jgi:hypothetical protein
MELVGNNSLDRRKRRNPDITGIASDFGKVPPQATDLEEAVLGALMLEQNAINAVIDILKPESFYKETHKGHHIDSYQKVLNWWKTIGKTLTIEKIMNL